MTRAKAAVLMRGLRLGAASLGLRTSQPSGSTQSHAPSELVSYLNLALNLNLNPRFRTERD